MRPLLLFSALAAAVACATSSTLPRSETYGAPPDALWRAALVAVEELGGRVITAEAGARYVLGRLEDTSIGSTVTLDITVREWMDGGEVRVKASTPDSADGLSPSREDALRQLEEDLLELIGRLTGSGVRPRGPGGS